MDEPDHSKYRQATQSWFTQQRIQSLEDRIRTIARASIDRMAELVQLVISSATLRFIIPYSMQILGVPEADEPRMSS